MSGTAPTDPFFGPLALPVGGGGGKMLVLLGGAQTLANVMVDPPPFVALTVVPFGAVPSGFAAGVAGVVPVGGVIGVPSGLAWVCVAIGIESRLWRLRSLSLRSAMSCSFCTMAKRDKLTKY